MTTKLALELRTVLNRDFGERMSRAYTSKDTVLDIYSLTTLLIQDQYTELYQAGIARNKSEFLSEDIMTLSVELIEE